MSLLIKSAFEKVTENYGKLSDEEKEKFLNSLKPQEEAKEVEEEEEEETSTQEKEPVEAESEKEEVDKEEDEDGKFDEFSRMLDKYFETHKETKKSFGLGEKPKDYGNGKQKTYQEALNEAFKGR